MFIRIRRRALKGGHTASRNYRRAAGLAVPTQSASYDLVRAVRLAGKPRHQVVCGLGTIRPGMSERALVRFWIGAIRNMTRAGFDEEQKRTGMAMAHRKGVPLPSPDACLEEPRYGRVGQELAEAIAWASAA